MENSALRFSIFTEFIVQETKTSTKPKPEGDGLKTTADATRYARKNMNTMNLSPSYIGQRNDILRFVPPNAKWHIEQAVEAGTAHERKRQA